MALQDVHIPNQPTTPKITAHDVHGTYSSLLFGVGPLPDTGVPDLTMHSCDISNIGIVLQGETQVLSNNQIYFAF